MDACIQYVWMDMCVYVCVYVCMCVSMPVPHGHALMCRHPCILITIFIGDHVVSYLS